MSEQRARPPRQDRGVRRVEKILDAAEAEVLRAGVDGLTMHAVASRAATAAGSLYQFLPGKPALVAALCARHDRALALLAEETAARLAAPAGPGLAARAVAFLRPFVEYYTRHPVYLVLAEAAQRSDQARLTQRLADDGVALALADCLRPGIGAGGAERLEIACRMMVETGHAAIAASLAAPPAERALWQTELERMIAAYADTLA